MEVLVTGASGVLGKHVVERLQNAGHAVRAAGRRGTEWPLDLRNGRGMADAVDGVDAIVHCAAAFPGYQRVELEGLRALINAAPRARFVYPSIVGIDRVPFGYYRCKLACEGLLEGRKVDHVIVRLTQFHEFAERFSRMWLPVLPRHFKVQSLAASEAGAEVARLVDEGEGRVEDMGGPDVHFLAEQVRELRRMAGRRPWVLEVPGGKMSKALAAGGNLCRDGRKGRISWVEHVAARRDEQDASGLRAA